MIFKILFYFTIIFSLLNNSPFEKLKAKMKDSVIRLLQLFLPSSHFSTTIVKEEARYLGYIGNKVLYMSVAALLKNGQLFCIQ